MGHVLKASQVSTLMTKRLLQNLEIESNASNPTYQVDINSGLVGSDDGTVVMEVSSPITVDITASGVNGLDTGSEADNTWYYIWLIYNPSTDTVAGLFSTSNSSPTMPSGYTKKRLIGAVRNAFGSDFCEFYQHGEEVFYRYDIQVLAAGSATSQTGIDCSNFVPSIASLIKCYAYCWTLASSVYTYFRWFTGFTYFNTYQEAATTRAHFPVWDMPTTSQTVYYYHSNSDGQLWWYVTGFRLKL